MRRNSDPISTKGKLSSNAGAKLITATHASPISFTNEDDPVAYERNHKALVTEFKRPQAKKDTIIKLLSLTHTIRRKRITESSDKVTIILEEYPFFKSKAWVSYVVDNSCVHVRLSYIDSRRVYTTMWT